MSQEDKSGAEALEQDSRGLGGHRYACMSGNTPDTSHPALSVKHLALGSGQVNSMSPAG